MIHSTTHSPKNLGLVLDASFEDPLRPIHAGSGLGNCMGCSRGVGAFKMTLGPRGLGFTAPSGTALAVGALVGVGAGLFLWKHKTGRRMVRRTKKALGFGR